MNAITQIEQQQAREKGRTPAWMVGEQLKDICRREPASAELLEQDLQNASQSITAAEKKIKAWADGHRTGNFACVTPMEADRILREFYGLAANSVQPPVAEPERAPRLDGNIINLEDFL